MVHYFNPCEGNGQSHTYCGAAMTVAEYNAFLDASEDTPQAVCLECNRKADAADEYAYYYDL
jgi:hypothetical protein